MSDRQVSPWLWLHVRLTRLEVWAGCSGDMGVQVGAVILRDRMCELILYHFHSLRRETVWPVLPFHIPRSHNIRLTSLLPVYVKQLEE